MLRYTAAVLLAGTALATTKYQNTTGTITSSTAFSTISLPPGELSEAGWLATLEFSNQPNGLSSFCSNKLIQDFESWIESNEVDATSVLTITGANTATISAISGTTEVAAETDTFSYSYTDYPAWDQFKNQYKYSLPCCGECLVYIDNVRLFYWTPETTTRANYTYATTTVINDTTVTSPDAYLVYQGIDAEYDLCGPVDNHTIASQAVTMKTQDLSYLMQYVNTIDNGNPGNLGYVTFPYDLSSGLSLCSSLRNVSGSLPYYESSTIVSGTLAVWDPCYPILAAPQSFTALDPAWEGCQIWARGAVDPPQALTPQQQLVPSTPTPQPASSPTLTQPSQTPTSNDPPRFTSQSTMALPASGSGMVSPTDTSVPAEPISTGASDPPSSDPQGSDPTQSGSDPTSPSSNPDPSSDPGSDPGSDPSSSPSDPGTNPSPSQNSDPSPSSEPLVIGSQTASFVPSGIAVGTETATIGGAPITVGTVPVSAGTGGVIIVGSQTISPANPASPAPTPSATVLELGGATLTLAPGGSGLIVNGQTLTEGAPEVTIGGVPVSLGTSDLVVGSVTEAFSAAPLASAGASSDPGIGSAIINAWTAAGGTVVTEGSAPSATGASNGTIIIVGGASRGLDALSRWDAWIAWALGSLLWAVMW